MMRLRDIVSLLSMSKREEELATTLDEAVAIMRNQNDLLMNAAKEIAGWQERALASIRACRDLAVAFRLQQETPEIDVRDDLDELIQQLSDDVAFLEEHITN